jgi:hypothetical protein
VYVNVGLRDIRIDKEESRKRRRKKSGWWEELDIYNKNSK